MAWEVEIKQERRLCIVRGDYGLVEFEDGIRLVDPTDIKFCDEENEMLSVFNKKGE